jgi:integrase
MSRSRSPTPDLTFPGPAEDTRPATVTAFSAPTGRTPTDRPGSLRPAGRDCGLALGTAEGKGQEYQARRQAIAELGEELTRLERACVGRSFAQRRDTAIITVLRATGIRLAEVAGLRYDPGDPRRSDIDLWQRQITVRGKGGKDRIVRVGYQAVRSLDRYIRARSRHAQAWRPQL